MATNTTNYNLVKQDEEEFYDVNVVNANLDRIDTAIKQVEQAATNIDLSEIEQDIADVQQEFIAHKGDNATLTRKGHVQLSNAVNSESESLAATSKAVKLAYDRAEAAFTQANDIKNKWANVVGSPLSTSDTQAQLQSKTQTIKDTLASNLTEKGQTSTGSETLTELVNKVPNISSGKRVAVKFFNATTSTMSFKTSTGANRSQAYVSINLNDIPFTVGDVWIRMTDSSMPSGSITHWTSSNFYNSGGESGNCSVTSYGSELYFKITVSNNMLHLPITYSGNHKIQIIEY